MVALQLDLQPIPTCNVTRNSGIVEVPQPFKLIMWDKCTMAYKKHWNDSTLKDLRGNGQSFGRAHILLSGDFRQTLPVFLRLTPADELNSCLQSSVLWKHVKELTLKINIPMYSIPNDVSVECFVEQLLDIGNGKMAIDRQIDLKCFPKYCAKLQKYVDSKTI